MSLTVPRRLMSLQHNRIRLICTASQSATPSSACWGSKARAWLCYASPFCASQSFSPNGNGRTVIELTPTIYCRYGPAPSNADSAINILLDVVKDQSGKQYTMDHYQTRFPTNVLDIANFLVRLAGKTFNLFFSSSHRLFIRLRDREAKERSFASSNSLLS
jgi:hypothetical protein